MVIFDIHSVLYNWDEARLHALDAMFMELADSSDVPKNILESEANRIFRERGNREYPFIIQELPSLKRRHPLESFTKRYASAISRYRESRDDLLRLEASVSYVLDTLRERGCLIVGICNATIHDEKYRLQHLDLEKKLDMIYCSPVSFSEVSDDAQEESGEFPDWLYHQLGASFSKPDPRLLLNILDAVPVAPMNSMYVGGSLTFDMTMAANAGVIAVWKKSAERIEKDYYWDGPRLTQCLPKGKSPKEPALILEDSILEMLDFENGIQYLPYVARD